MKRSILIYLIFITHFAFLLGELAKFVVEYYIEFVFVPQGRHHSKGH